MKRIKFSQTFFEVGGDGYSRAKFEAGQHYEPSEDTRRCVARGIAAEVEVPDPVKAAGDDASSKKSAKKA